MAWIGETGNAAAKIVRAFKTERWRLAALGLVVALASLSMGLLYMEKISAGRDELARQLAETKARQEASEAAARTEMAKLEKERDEIQARVAEKMADGRRSLAEASGGIAGSALGSGNSVSTSAGGGSGSFALANSKIENSSVSYVVQNFTTIPPAELTRTIRALSSQDGSAVIERLMGDSSTGAQDVIAQVLKEKFSFRTDSTVATQYRYRDSKICPVALIGIVPLIDKSGKYALDIRFAYSAEEACSMRTPTQVTATISDKDALGNFVWDKESGCKITATGEICDPKKTYGIDTQRRYWYRLVWHGDQPSVSDISRLNVTYKAYQSADANSYDHLRWSAADGKISRK